MASQEKARASKITTAPGASRAEAGYKSPPGGLTPTPTPSGYPYSAEIRVSIDPDMDIDLSAAKPVARPADDDSIRQLARATAAKDTPPPPAPAAASPAPTPPAGAPSPPSGNGRSSRKLSKRALTPAIAQELRKEILAKCDRDQDGKLDRREVYGAYQYIRESKYIRYFDENRNGKLDRDEYGPFRDFLEKLN